MKKVAFMAHLWQGWQLATGEANLGKNTKKTQKRDFNAHNQVLDKADCKSTKYKNSNSMHNAKPR